MDAANKYDKNCEGCKFSQGLSKPQGGIVVTLDDYWVLNHYGGSEGFLGWLALQPRYHKMELSQLKEEEARSIGPHVQQIESTLRNYWSRQFSDDPIERLYIVYFFESAFESDFSRKSNPYYHLHIHLIPRTKKLGGGIPWQRAAWGTAKLVEQDWFPPEYQTKDKAGVEKARNLMEFLEEGLTPRATPA